ncbi:MAG TPA: NlpC/P60 family protein, partial [Chitinophagaceae bacterium]|nr:NlpC/P60 family protein [Chitinophagaceae bacterium]
NHFNIAVPRSSVDFTNVRTEVDYRNAKPGDLILFTGTDSTIRIVGHMGIVESFENEVLKFIHSTSGKAKGVVITEFGKYYKSRFVKVIRIFPDDKF